MKKLFLIIGAPGSGKTTDASIIAQKHSETIVHYSSGDMLRAEVAKGTKLGQTIDSYISKGLLVPIDIIMNSIITAIQNAPVDTVLLDGYPRSVEQMMALDAKLKEQNEIKLISVIEVRVSQAVAKERILGRVAESQIVRNDDSEEIFYDRMKVYTKPLLDIQTFYADLSILEVLDGERSLEKVVEDMEFFIENKISHSLL